ncbi:MAG: glycosyltransferase [Candidatus Lambdaproteobacteria bacterium]|nr:glycosyltransferase [Candidatus Lambdaproteobacteria bacterium]
MSAPGGEVLFVNLSRGWGGGEQWHLSAAQGLRARGRTVALLVYPGGVLAARAAAAGLAIWPQALRNVSLLNPLRVMPLVRELRLRHPAAVILNAAHELKVVGLAARWCGVPRVVLRRGIPVAPRRTALNRWVLRHVPTRLIVNSQATLDAMSAEFPEEVAHLRPLVIHNGVDPEVWRPPARRADSGTIAVVGRLTAEKGVARALEVLARLRARVPQARMLVIGDGLLRPQLEAQAGRLGLAGAVEFLGQRDDVPALLAGCDVLLLASHWEGFAYVLAEAMLTELPTAAFDIPAVREVTVPGETGLIVPDGDLDGMATALAALLGDAPRRAALGAAGRRRALDKFALQRTLDQLEALLDEPDPEPAAPRASGA